VQEAKNIIDFEKKQYLDKMIKTLFNIFRDFLSVLWVLVSIYAFPGLIYWFFVPSGLLWIPYSLGTFSILLVNFFLLIQIFVALYRKYKRGSNRQDVQNKQIAVIVPAFIINEIFVIEKTLQTILSSKIENNQMEILISYNGSTIGKELLDRFLQTIVRDLTSKYQIPISAIPAPNSKSKADNVNMAIDYILNRDQPLPDVVFLFDADHQPNLNCIQQGINYLYQGNYDVVQGRNIIQYSKSLFDRLVAVEFDQIYAVEHSAMDIFRGFAIFGGSNAVWRFDALDDIRMKNNRLTEDIDSSFRALRKGYRIGYFRDMISWEQAPFFPSGLFWQRLRWAQGWFECSLIHTRFAFDPRSKFRGNFYRNMQNRLSIVLMLICRDLYYYIAAQSLPSGLIGLLKTQEFDALFSLLVCLTISIFIFPFFTVLLTMLIAKKQSKISVKYYFIYCLFAPFYELFKYHVVILSHARTFLLLKKWKITDRRL